MITIRVLHLYRLNRRNTTEIKSQKSQSKANNSKSRTSSLCRIVRQTTSQPSQTATYCLPYSHTRKQSKLYYTTTSSLSSSTFPFKHLDNKTKKRKKKMEKSPKNCNNNNNSNNNNNNNKN